MLHEEMNSFREEAYRISINLGITHLNITTCFDQGATTLGDVFRIRVYDDQYPVANQLIVFTGSTPNECLREFESSAQILEVIQNR
jgi:hypothetical protein